MTTKVIHVAEMSHYDDAVYIGRRNNRFGLPESPFANPFKIGAPIGFDGIKATRQDVIAQYKLWIMAPAQRHLLALLPDLRNRPIACWCRHDGDERTPDNACHGDVLVALLEAHTDDELRAMAVQS